MLTYNELANLILSYESMSPKKLQKIAYYAQAWYYTLYDKILINKNFEAWVHGPVCPEIYHEFKSFGWNEIPKRNFTIDNEEVSEFMNIIYNTFGKFTGDELEDMTHNEDPWMNERIGLKPYEASNNVIKLEDMKVFYTMLREQNQDE